MSYRVRTNIFEGPFDLLVYLISRARMSIYDIRISEITAQYIKYIEQMQEADVNLASEFMVLAAQLLEIKSKMLLPRVAVDEEGETVYEDPRTELVAKLAEYQKYKAASEMLEQRREYAALSLEKPQEDLTEFTGEPDEYLILDAEKFRAAFEDFLERKRRLEEIRAHHRQRLKEIEAQLAAHPRLTGFDLTRQLRWASQGDGWDRFPTDQKYFAVCETLAHLDHLVLTGRVLQEENGEGQFTYRLAPDKEEEP